MPRAAGVFMYTRRRADEPLLIVLQRRGLVILDKNEKKFGEAESFPNGFQPTCHGSIQPEESSEEAAARESVEELGVDISDRQLVPLTESNANAALYGLFVQFDWISNIRLHPSTGGLYPMTEEIFRRTVECVPFPQRRHFPSTQKWGMVDDEYAAALKGFKEFDNAVV